MHRALILLGIAAVVIAGPDSLAQAPRMNYRVVYASTRQLTRQLDQAGHEGYACVLVAQTDPGAGVPGIVVVLGRPVGGASAPISHRVIAGGGTGADLAAPLERAGVEGFRLCGSVLDEEPPVPAVVAIASRETAAPISARHYGVEPLTNYKESLVRLGAAARNGFRPVAATPINNNRVPEMRSWLVITEQAGPIAAREVAVRSSSAADGFQRALNEQTAQGYCADLIWKEGNDIVAMLSRARDSAPATCAYLVEMTTLAKIHTVSHLYVADVPFRAPADRLIISERSLSATNDIEDDVLPTLGPSGYVEASALGIVGDHISRHRPAVPLSARVHRMPNGAFVLTTVVSERSR